MAKRRTNQPRLSVDLARNIGIGIIVVIALFFLVRGFVSLVNRSPLFRIREIVVAENVGPMDIPEFERIKGLNILTVSLDKLEAKIRSKYPAFSNLRVMRKFPDQIFVTAVKREPFVRAVLNGRTMLIDREGYVIGASTDQSASLTLVKGLRSPKSSTGDAVGDPHIATVAEIVSRFRNERKLTNLTLSSIDLSDPGRISCLVGREESSIEVLFDIRSFSPKIGELAVLLSHGDVDFGTIKYIDLRFDAPIMGQKKTKRL